MTHTVDATGKSIGRTASIVAALLLGKNKPTVERNKVTGEKVNLINASKAKVTETKMDQKTYAKYSGYPGGLRHEKMAFVVSKKGYSEVFKTAIHGMLPDNKLRAKMMNNLTISE